MSAHVLRADARQLPLPDSSVDLVITSPPYFALRSYRDAGEHYDGQIGSEASPAEFLEALWSCTEEWIRVLKPTGSLWVNLGDKYAGGGSGPDPKRDRSRFASAVPNLRHATWGARPKSLLGLPWRYALGCIDNLGLILRAEVIWSKPNALPESVGDRVRRTHEQWFHFTLAEQYYAAVDEIREPHTGNAHNAGRHAAVTTWESGNGAAHRTGRTDRSLFDPRGKLPGSVWTVQSEPLTAPADLGVDHFAAFPTEWPRRLILGWSPPAICTACGEGRRPTVDVVQEPNGRTNSGRAKRQALAQLGHDRGFNAAGYPHTTRVTEIRGHVCACTPFIDHPERRRPTSTPKRDDLTHRPARGTGRSNTFPAPGPPVREYLLEEWEPAPTRPAVVLDPFGGTGTTALVASVLGRVGITVDRSHDYSRLAAWRTTDPGERARAARLPKPPVQATGQLGLDLAGDPSTAEETTA